MNIKKRLQDLEEVIKGNPIKNVWDMDVNNTYIQTIFKKVREEKLSKAQDPTELDKKLASMREEEKAVYLTNLALGRY